MDPVVQLADVAAAWWQRVLIPGQAASIRDEAHWIRFHGLPESKRYADTPAEAEIILSRHRELLRALGLDGTCLVVSTWWSGPPKVIAEMPESTILERHPGSVVWREAPDEETGLQVTLRVSVETFPSGTLDRFLTQVADEEVVGATILPPSAAWIYHPYDGGADLVPPSEAERDALASRFSDWLPKSESGL